VLTGRDLVRARPRQEDEIKILLKKVRQVAVKWTKPLNPELNPIC
jgi:hypothetical protein